MNVLPWEMPPEGAARDTAVAVAAGVPEITSDRLRLRAPRIEDYRAYEAVLTSARAQYLGKKFGPEEAFADFCQGVVGWMLRGAGMWTLCHKDSETALGWIFIWTEYGDYEPELGWILTEAAEGKGYAFEAAKAALPHALSLYGTGGVVSYINPKNTRSIRLAERLGGQRDDAAAAKLDWPVLVYRYKSEALA